MPLALSQLGRYQLIRQLGSRAQGTIYLAQDSQMSSQVAIKLFHINDALHNPDHEIIERIEEIFSGEIQTLAQLTHARILPICDSGLEKIGEDNYIYIAMPYCPAGSLQDWLAKTDGSERLSLSTIAQVLAQTAEALYYAHERGITHQGVKPANLLLHTAVSQSEAPDLLLTDFGMARLFALLSTRGISQSPYVRSTSMSRAPEQWKGKAVPASDQYALAILAFRLLTGQYPFHGTLSEIIHQHHTIAPPPPSSFNPQLDASVDEIILRALAKEAKRRFPSILDFAQAFAQFQRAYDDRAPDLAGVQFDQAETLILEPHPVAFAPAHTEAATDLAAEPPPLLTSEATDLVELSAAEPEAAASVDLAEPSALACAEPTVRLAPLLAADKGVPLADESTARIIAGSAPEATENTTDLILLASSDPVASLPEENSQETLSALATSLLSHETPTRADNDPAFATPADEAATVIAAPANAFADSPPAASSDKLVVMAHAYASTLAPTHLKVAPPLPVTRIASPLPPLALHPIPQRKTSLLRKSLLVALLALVILSGGGAFLWANLAGQTAVSAGGPDRHSASTNAAQPGQTSPASTSITIIVTTTPTAGDDPTATSGAASSSGSTPVAGATQPAVPASAPQTQSTPTPTTRPAPTPTPTTRPTPTPTPRPTPTPTPHPCLIHYWTLTLTTYSKGGHALYVSPYCHGVVYLTLTKAPASAGHQVYLQICYALNSTNCSAWVAYSSPNVWLKMASGLKTNQVFYINGKCSGCTSQFVMYGGAKY